MEITIQTSSKGYPVFIEKDAIQQVKTVVEAKAYTKLLIITDETVAKFHLQTLKEHLPEAFECTEYIVPSGEVAKQFSVYEQCLNIAIERGLDRKSCILALGGGAVGDLSGFVAATFMRGIDFIQIPTTILAHDSAVGGKTGINLSLGKNMVGAFHQPEAVIYDIQFLNTLPTSEIRSGFAEVVKHALIADQSFLTYLMTTIEDLENIDDDVYQYILKRGIEIKAAVVTEDEKETGIRAYLNFGHTLGHAIETTAGYGAYTHGEAVMIGMIYALEVSKEKVGLDAPINELKTWLEKLGYQLQLPQYLQFDQAYEAMQRDKKSVGAKPYFVLLEAVGKPTLLPIEREQLERVYTAMK